MWLLLLYVGIDQAKALVDRSLVDIGETVLINSLENTKL